MKHTASIRASALTLSLLFASAAAGVAHAQATDQDKHFLDDTAKDSNYEIRTGQLALQKSPSADVKQYATMVIHDHTALLGEVRAADAAAKVTPPDKGSMSLSEDASYAKLKLLSGASFDKSYIQGLIKGNQDSVQQGKDEAANTKIPAVKSLANHRVALDTKHAKKADALAAAHHVKAD